MELNMDILYHRIKELREKRELSQEELAHKTGYKSRTSIAKIEAGKVDLPQSKISAFADALNTTTSYLLGWDWDVVNMDLSDVEACVINSYRHMNADKQHAVNKYLNIWDNPCPEEEENFDVTLIELTQKYVMLDKYGKEMVDMVLDKEYRRCSAMESSNTSHLTPIAAHNDDADDEEQQRLMQQDIDEL